MRLNFQCKKVLLRINAIPDFPNHNNRPKKIKQNKDEIYAKMIKSPSSSKSASPKKTSGIAATVLEKGIGRGRARKKDKTVMIMP